MQSAQIVLALFISVAMIISVTLIGDNVEDFRQKLIDDDIPDYTMDYVPTKKMVESSLYPAACVSTFVMFLLIIIYVPRYVRNWLWEV